MSSNPSKGDFTDVFLYILFFCVLILSFALEHFFIFFYLFITLSLSLSLYLSLSLSLSLSLNIVFFFLYHLSNAITINFSLLPMTNFLHLDDHLLTVSQLLLKSMSARTSRKHLRTKVTPDFHLTYSKNGVYLGSESK